MGNRLFGTDGVRGVANIEPITSETALRLGRALAEVFRAPTGRHRRILIGKDTRLSGYMLETAMASGICSMGVDVWLVGPMPTPAIAFLTRSMRADAGVVISASHNPYEDNGIKLFGPDGYKLSDETELEIEAAMATDLSSRLAPSAQLGRAARLEDAGGRFIESVKANFPRGMRLDGLRIVIDCANGAAYRVAPAVLWELGAEVIRIGVEPDGFNINSGCGSTAPALMQEEVRRHGAHLGVALDGDADRVIIADETGALVDGDQILALIARAWSDAGRLTGGGIVATVMSNLGLERFLGARGLALHRTRVGDRYVMETMRSVGCNVGGEQSGHILLLDHGTTGCGLTAALQVLVVLVETGGRASEAMRVFEPLPQLLRNVRYEGASPLETARVRAAIAAAERELGTSGRLVIRPSGTEPVIRVMAEAEDQGLVTSLVDSLCDEIARAAA